MADPLDPEQTQEETLPASEPTQVTPPVQAQPDTSLDQFLYGDKQPQQPQQDLNTFLYGTPKDKDAIDSRLAVAQQVIDMANDPMATDLFTSIGRKLTEPGKSEAAWKDYEKNLVNFDPAPYEKFKEAQDKGDWKTMASTGLQIIGQDWGNYIAGALGMTNEEREKTQQSYGARMIVGKITDPKEAAETMILTDKYKEDLKAGKSLAPENQPSAMSFGTGPLSLKLGMNLTQADEYLKTLQDTKTQAFGQGALRNFAIQSGDAFIPFVSVGDIIIDEKDKDQVARRAALAEAINQTISKDYFYSTVSGQALGSLGSFMAAGAGTTSLLGESANMAGKVLKVPTKLSQAAMYGVMGTSQSVKTDERNLSPMERLASIASESFVLGLSERGGDVLGDQIDNGVANLLKTQAMARLAPEFAPVVGGVGKALSIMIGESASDQLDAAARGKNPFEDLALSYGTNFGIGAGLALAGMPRQFRKARVMAQADDSMAADFTKGLSGIRNDTNKTDEQKLLEVETIKRAFGNNERVNLLIDRAWALSAVDENTAPETHQVLKESVDVAKRGIVETILDAGLNKENQQENVQAVGQQTGELMPGVPLPGDQEQAELEKMKNYFLAGNKEIRLENTIENAEKIKWLESKGYIYGNLVENGSAYVVKGVRMGQGDLAKWYGEDDPRERFQGEKDDLDKAITKAHTGTSQELDVKVEEIQNAATYDDLRRIGNKYLGVPLTERILEGKLIETQDRIAEENAINARLKVLNSNLAAIRKQREQSPEDEQAPLDETIAKFEQEIEKLTTGKKAQGEANVLRIVKDMEDQVDEEIDSGKIAPEVLANPEVIIAILNPKNASHREHALSEPSPIEEDPTKLGEAFDLEDARVVENLKRIGAIDDQGRPLMTPAGAIAAYALDKRNYLTSKSLSGYQSYGIADQVYNATVNKALLELRKGNKIALSTIFNSNLIDFIRKAKVRMRSGVGLGAMTQLKEQIKKADPEKLIEDLGLDENQAQLVKDTFDEISATDAEWQASQPGAVATPSVTERVEATAIIANEIAPLFRQSLKSDLERLAFDSLVDSKVMAKLDSLARQLGSDINEVKTIQQNLQKQLIEQIKAEYRARLTADNLPSLPAPEGEVRKAGNLTSEQLKPTENFFARAKEETLMTDEELKDFEEQMAVIRSGRRVEDLRNFQQELIALIDSKLGIEDGVFSADVLNDWVELLGGVEGNPDMPGQLKISLAKGVITQADYDTLLKQLNASMDKAVNLINNAKDIKDVRAAAREARASFVRINNAILPKEKKTNAKPIAKQTGISTTSGSDQTKPVSKEQQKTAKPGEGKQPAKPGKTKGSTSVAGGVSRVLQRIGAAILPKTFSTQKGQGTVPYSEDVITSLGGKFTDPEHFSPDQRQDAAASIASMEGSKNKSFYLADGAGTGKTRILLGVGQHFLNKEKKVLYLTSSDAVTPDWGSRTIGGTIQKDAELLGVPIVAYGGKASGLRDLTSLPSGTIVVSTYNDKYMAKLLELVDNDTVVIFDEHHSGRNIFQAEQEGNPETKWPVLMDKIAKKAGAVLMASGTPFDKPDQLLSLARLGIFDSVSPEQLLFNLGFKKYNLSTSNRYYWDLAPGVTVDEMQDRMERYFNKLAFNGVYRSRSLKLDGVNVEFKNVPLDAGIRATLDSIAERFGGSESMASRMAAVVAQKRALETYKVKAAAQQAYDAIKRGVKPIVYVGFVSKEDSRGNKVDQVSKQVEEELKRIIAQDNPELAARLNVARLFSGGDGKQLAMDKFNNQGADVLIATVQMGGTGIELDDKAGDQPREMIIMSPPISAISAVQLIYRVWRADTASRPNIVFMTAEHQVDQEPLEKMRQRMRLLDATMGAGFQALKGESKSKLSEEYLSTQTIPSSFWKLPGINFDAQRTLSDAAFAARHELDLFEEGEEGVSRSEYNTIKNWLDKNVPGYYEATKITYVGRGTAKEEIQIPVKGSPENIKFVNDKMTSIFKGDFKDGVVKIKDPSGKTVMTYKFNLYSGFDGPARADFGQVDEEDTITLNPDRMAAAAKVLGDKFDAWLQAVVLEEALHLETVRMWRAEGKDISAELRKVARGMSAETRRSRARLYFAAQGYDLNNPEIKAKIEALASDDLQIAFEALRQNAQLALYGVVSEQLAVVSAADIARVKAVADEALRSEIDDEDKTMFSTILSYINNMLAVLKRGFGAPQAMARISMREALQEAATRLTKTKSEYTELADTTEPEAAPFQGSPAQPISLGVFGSYDLRVNKLIEDHLDNNTDNVFGLKAANDSGRTVDKQDWLFAIEQAYKNGTITKFERNMYRAAGLDSSFNNRVSLTMVPVKALEIGEAMETGTFEGSKSAVAIPTVALTPFATVENAPVTDSKIQGKELYRFALRGYLPQKTQADSIDQGLSQGVAKLLSTREKVVYEGQDYTWNRRGALVRELQRRGVNNYVSKVIPSAAEPVATIPPITLSVSLTGDVVTTPVAEPTPIAPQAAGPRVVESQAMKNLLGTFGDNLPDVPFKQRLMEDLYNNSVTMEQQFEDARNYIEGQNSFSDAVRHYLSNSIDTPLPIQAAVGFELLRVLSPQAKTDRYAREVMTQVMLVQKQRYGTDPGRTVQLWAALSEMSDNPEAMKMYVHEELSSIAAGRLEPYKRDLDDARIGLQEAGRKAADRVATDPTLKSTIDKIAQLIEKNRKEQNFEGIDKAMYSFIISDEAQELGDAFLGPIASKPQASDVPGFDADEIRLVPERIKNLGLLISRIINSSDSPDALQADVEKLRSLVYSSRALRNNPNQAEVRRLVELYFDAAFTYSQALREAESKGVKIAPITSITKGEATKQAEQARIRAEDAAPVILNTDLGDELLMYADAAATLFERKSKRLQEEPKKKEFVEEMAKMIRMDLDKQIREKGGLKPKFEKPIPRTPAQNMLLAVQNIDAVRMYIAEIRDILLERYKGKEAELVGLEPLIDDALDHPLSVSAVAKTIKSLQSIGGPKVNVRELIRSSRGDIEAFENKLSELLTQNSKLDAAQIKVVNDYLRDAMAKFVAEERKKELERIKRRIEEKRGGKKAKRQVSSALSKLMEAGNLGVLRDQELFDSMRVQLGLPEMTPEQLAHLDKMIEDLPNWPKGRVRNQKISKMYEYVKLLSPMTVTELLVNYQTMNLLLGLGTIGINASSSFANNIAQSAIIAARGATKVVTGTIFNKPAETIRGIGYLKAAIETYKPFTSWKKGIGLQAAKEIFLKGDFSSVQSVTTMEMGGVNMFEAFSNQLDSYLKKSSGAMKPEITIKTPGWLEWIGLNPEYTFSLANKYAWSKFNPATVGPFIIFGRAMAAGDAMNTISAKKMYQTAEAYNIALKKGLTSRIEVEQEVARLLNSTPEARARAEAIATAESKEMNYTPYQYALRVEEIIEQNRPQDEISQDLIKRTERFAERSNFRNNFEGVLGAAAASAVTLSNVFPPAKFVLKYLKTGAALGNAALDVVPLLGTWRYYKGIGNFERMRDSKFFSPPPQKDTVEQDIALGKMWLSYILGLGLLALLRKALDRDPDPDFNIHISGPKDPAQRKALLAAGWKARSIQIGSFADGNPRFISFEALPPFLAGMFIPLGAFTEAIRYEKRSKQEALVPTIAAASWMTIYAMLDYSFLSGIRGLIQLAAPSNGATTSTGQLENIIKFTGNIASTLVPGYAILRDVEKMVEGIYGLPTGRLYQDSYLSVFLASVPFASKVGEPALDFLGGTTRAKFWNSVPFVRRIMTTGADTSEYAQGVRTEDAIHDKLISLFAKNQTALDWEAGPLKVFAAAELATKPTVGISEILTLKRELTETEKYAWLKRSYPYIIESLGGNIEALESLEPEEFKYVVGQLARPFMKLALYEVLGEEKQDGIINELSPEATNVLPTETK
jgi:hypothetical protein